MLKFVILSYNHPVITARCVSSVLKFLRAENVALLHNGSENLHIQELKNQFPQIQHWHLEKNYGYSAGVNEAFRKSFETCEWIFLMTNDTELTRWDLEISSLEVGLYSPKIWLRKEGRIDSCGGLFNSRRGRLQHLREPLTKKDLSWGQYLYAPGTAFLLSKAVHEKLGGMDETLHTYWDDVDFGARATKQNIFMSFLPGVQLIHQGRKTTGKDSFYTGFLFHRNRLLVSWRHCPNSLKWMLVPLFGKFLKFKYQIKNQSSIERFAHSRRWR